MAKALELRGFHNHEFGDFVLIEREAFAPAKMRGRDIAAGGARMRYFPA
jgi:hypothetical protein